MEDDAREFFVKIIETISLIVVCMLLNVYLGLYKKLAFFDAMPRWYNYLYYLFLIASLTFLVIKIRKKWKPNVDA